MCRENTLLSYRVSQKTVNRVRRTSLFKLSIVTIINRTLVRAGDRNCTFERGAIASVSNPGGKIKTCIALFAMLAMSFMESCLDPYSAPAALSHVNYLVVEGFLYNESEADGHPSEPDHPTGFG